MDGIQLLIEDAAVEAMIDRMLDSNMGARAAASVLDSLITPYEYELYQNDYTGMIIHEGIDTVKLEGKGFDVQVEAGQHVNKGDVLMKLDLDYLKANAPSVTTPVICTELKNNQKIRLLAEIKKRRISLQRSGKIPIFAT